MVHTGVGDVEGRSVAVVRAGRRRSGRSALPLHAHLAGHTHPALRRFRPAPHRPRRQVLLPPTTPTFLPHLYFVPSDVLPLFGSFFVLRCSLFDIVQRCSSLANLLEDGRNRCRLDLAFFHVFESHGIVRVFFLSSLKKLITIEEIPN